MTISRDDRVNAGVAHMQSMFGDTPTETTPAAAEPDVVTSATTPPPRTEDTSGLAAIARAEARAREMYEAQKAELDKKREGLEKGLAAVNEFEQLRGRFREDPLGTARKLLGADVSDDDIVGMFYGSLPVGDAGPTDGLSKIQARIDRLEKENQTYKQDLDKKLQEKDLVEFQKKYTNDIASYLKGSDSSEYDLARDYYEANPDIAMTDMMAMAGHLAQQNPNGPLVKPSEVAKYMNDKLLSLFGPILEKRSKKSAAEDKSKAVHEKLPADNRTLRNATSPTTAPQRSPGLSDRDRYANAVAWMKSNVKLD